MSLVEKVARALCTEYIEGADDSFASAIIQPGVYADPRKKKGYLSRKRKFVEMNYKSYMHKAAKLLGVEE